MSETSFKKLNCCAALIAVAIFSLLIAASVVDWYEWDQTYQTSSTGVSDSTTLNYTRMDWTVEGVTERIKATSDTEKVRFTEYSNDTSSDTWSIFKLVQAFTLITAGILGIFVVLTFVDSIRNKLLFVMGMTVLRILLVVSSIVILLSVSIAFLGFLGITDAFSADIPNCTFGFCKKFSDSTKDDVGTTTVSGATVGLTMNTSWGPTEGWYITLATIPLAVGLILITVINKFPIPVESFSAS